MNGDCMQIDNAIDRFKIMLQGNPIANGTKIIAKMQIAGWLDAGKDTAFSGGCLRG
jgi:hypothetical protein